MKRVSVEEAFQWSQRFIAREWRLLLPVALAFMALPYLLMDLLLPRLAPGLVLPPIAEVEAGRASIPVAMLALGLAVLLLSTVGQLALTALAVVPRISVREAIGRGFASIGAVLAAWLMLGCVFLLATMAAGIVMTLAGLSAPRMQALLLPLLLVAGAAVWIRLVALHPVIVDRRAGPIVAIRTALKLSAGAFWRLAGALAIYMIGMVVVVAALHSALGTLILVGAKLVSQDELGQAIAAVLFRLLVAVGATGLQVLIAALYRQLAGSSRGI